MADHTITISNRINFLGGGPPDRWGTLVWGTDNWGYAADSIQAIDKLVANALSSDSAETKDFVRDTPVEDTLGLTDTITAEASFVADTITDTLTLGSDIVEAYLIHGTWYHVFPGGVTNSESRTSTSYSSASAATTSWTVASNPSTAWG